VKPFRPKRHGAQGPEAKIQKAIKEMLELKGWWVKPTHGNAHTSGWPDLWASHPLYGSRWIEVKLPGMKGSKFTTAQKRDFPKFCSTGSDVWILTAATEDEYQKLFKEGNWWLYLDILK
jgi:hypothetical protein